MTSNETANTINVGLQGSIHIKECEDKSQPVTIVEDVKLNIKGKQWIPSKHEILKSSTVGKPSIDYSFISEACFGHITIFPLKCEYLNKEDYKNILESRPLILYFPY